MHICVIIFASCKTLLVWPGVFKGNEMTNGKKLTLSMQADRMQCCHVLQQRLCDSPLIIPGREHV